MYMNRSLRKKPWWGCSIT